MLSARSAAKPRTSSKLLIGKGLQLNFPFLGSIYPPSWRGFAPTGIDPLPGYQFFLKIAPDTVYFQALTKAAPFCKFGLLAIQTWALCVNEIQKRPDRICEFPFYFLFLWGIIIKKRSKIYMIIIVLYSNTIYNNHTSYFYVYSV